MHIYVLTETLGASALLQLESQMDVKQLLQVLGFPPGSSAKEAIKPFSQPSLLPPPFDTRIVCS